MYVDFFSLLYIYVVIGYILISNELIVIFLTNNSNTDILFTRKLQGIKLWCHCLCVLFNNDI